MSNHKWTRENLDAYLAGGLTPGERGEVEQHTAACPECAQAMDESRKLERIMDEIFAAGRPDAALEQRAIVKLRRSRVRRASAWRFITAAAAVLVLGVVGFAVQAIAQADSPIRKAWQGPSARNEMAAMASLKVETFSGFIATENPGSQNERFSVVDVDPAAVEFDTDIQFNNKRIEEVSVPGQVNPNEAVVLKDDTRSMGPLNIPAPGGYGSIGQGGALDSLSMGEVGGYRSKGKPQDKTLNGRSGSTSEKPLREGGEKAPKLPALPDANLGFGVAIIKPEPKAEEWRRFYANDSRDSFLVPDPKLPTGTETNGLFPPGVGFGPPPVTTTKKTVIYFQSPEPADPTKTPPPPDAKPEKEKKDIGKKKPGDGPPGNSDESLVGGKKGSVKVDPDDGRKIIRTGTMEFEVNDFDAAYTKIKALIAPRGSKGAFIATKNSEKLPNGKVAGSVVVRMPPQLLDEFIDDLRRDLAKMGMLLGERIGSQDVTKQYTDVESELKAARAVEGRLIEIISTKKGEIKDLIAAEAELGKWRTKIEKMEGEIRYYNNQIGLSTITISLIEKEILAPFAVVVTDHVKLRVEVDDVLAAHKIAVKAVEDAKGRITRAEVKQYKAGQLEGILQAEVPPNAKEAVREALKKLGIPSDHEETQRQQTVGGAGKPQSKIERRVDDVHFDVTLNNIVNIQPRHSATLVVATIDVPGQFAKLQNAIKDAKGQVRDGRVNEQDKQNITATIDFNVPTGEKGAIDALIEAAGPMLTRSTSQAAVTELSTDRKYGYNLTLRSVANNPRYSVALVIATEKVAEHYTKLHATVLKVGQIRDAKLDENDKTNVTAKLDFTIPTDQKPMIDELIEKAGPVLLKSSAQAPITELSTDKKYGYALTLRSAANNPPRETVTLKLEVQNVDAKVTSLKEMVKAGNGRVVDARVSRQENGQVIAELVFSVPLAVEDLLVRQIKESGYVLSQNSARDQNVPDNVLATARVDVTLFGTFAGKTPREKIEIRIEVTDVDKTAGEFRDVVRGVNGRVAGGKVDNLPNGQTMTELVFDVPLSSRDAVIKQIKNAAKNQKEQSFKTVTNTSVPETDLATARIHVTLVGSLLIPSDEGFGSYINKSLYFSFTILMFFMLAIITGLSVLVPVALVLGAGYFVIRMVWPAEKLAPVESVEPVKTPVVEKPAEGEKPAGSDKV